MGDIILEIDAEKAANRLVEVIIAVVRFEDRVRRP